MGSGESTREHSIEEDRFMIVGVSVRGRFLAVWPAAPKSKKRKAS